MQSYLKYKAYYDRSAKAAPLTTEDCCFILNPKADTQATKIPSRDFRWVALIKSRKSYRTITTMSADWAQIKPNYCIAFDYIPQAPLADNFVRETDWQKEDTFLAQVDLYAHTWGTNFGSSTFDREHETIDQQEGIVEYEPTSQPEIYRPPSPENSQSCWGTPAEQPSVNTKYRKELEKQPTENENHEPIPESSRNPKNSQDTKNQSKIHQKLPKITQKLMLKKHTKKS